MTAQEQQLLQGLTERISNTPLTEKDPRPSMYLQQTLGRNPDALYVLSQTVLVQQYALDNAQKQLADLRTQLEQAQQQQQQPKHTGSFLGNLLGLDKDDPPTQQQPPTHPFRPSPAPAHGPPISTLRHPRRPMEARSTLHRSNMARLSTDPRNTEHPSTAPPRKAVVSCARPPPPRPE